MGKLIKLEELGLFILGVVLFANLEYSWWVFATLLLVPDVSMAGYLFGNPVGASVYNLFHHRGIAALVYAAGVLLTDQVLMLAGIILFSHSCMDRIFGYGLKFFDSFHHTHLGRIGKNLNH